MVPCEDDTAPYMLPLGGSLFNTCRLSNVDREVTFLPRCQILVHVRALWGLQSYELRMISVAPCKVSHGEYREYGAQPTAE